MNSDFRTNPLNTFKKSGYSDSECRALSALVHLFTSRQWAPEPAERYPQYKSLFTALQKAITSQNGEYIEEALLHLYVHIHGYEAVYTTSERQKMDRTQGYWNHAGGIAPLIKARPYLSENSVSADFGAGNGLQCLLLQKLYPHKKSVQFEISSQAIKEGKHLQKWLDIGKDAIDWVSGDVVHATPEGIDFAYLYRPVKPDGPGRIFYQRFAEVAISSEYPKVIFSIADCLKNFLPAGLFKIFYSDGHLTCFKRIVKK